MTVQESTIKIALHAVVKYSYINSLKMKVPEITLYMWFGVFETPKHSISILHNNGTTTENSHACPIAGPLSIMHYTAINIYVYNTL